MKRLSSNYQNAEEVNFEPLTTVNSKILYICLTKSRTKQRTMDRDTETDSTLKERVSDILDTLNSLPCEENCSVSKCDIVFTFISIVSRVISIISTLLLANDYYQNSKTDYFTWTLCCFIIPMFVTMFLQLSM